MACTCTCTSTYVCVIHAVAPLLLAINGPSAAILETHSVQLSCKAMANPAPTWQWIKRNNDTQSNPETYSSRINITTEYNHITAISVSKLTFTGAVPGDAADYVCQVSNNVADQNEIYSEIEVHITRE